MNRFRNSLLILVFMLGVLSMWAATLNVPGDHATIQAAIDVANPGDVIEVAPGEYHDYILVDERVSIIGSGSGDDPLTDTIIYKGSSAPDAKTGVIQISASGLDAGNPILFQNLRVIATDRAGISVGRFTESTGTSVSYLKFINVQVWGDNANVPTEQERGFYVDNTSTASNLVFENCVFNNLVYGWYFQKAVSVDASTVSYVSATNCTFNHNNHKGIYAEKLDNASFINCTAANNGYDASLLPSYFSPWCAGFDINLKAGTYSNIIFNGCTVTDNGIGSSKEGVGLTVKGRADGGYSTYQATVSNVQVINCTITGNERGIRFGEPNVNNPSPTYVTVTGGNISGNHQTYTGTDGSKYGDIINATSSSDVTVNGSMLLAGQAIINVTDGNSIQAAIDAADPGDVIEVAAGTYPENVLLNKAVTLKGSHADTPYGDTSSGTIIAPLTGLPVSITASGATLNGFEITAPNNNNAVSINGACNNVQVLYNYIHHVGNTTNGSNVHSVIYSLGSNNSSNLVVSYNKFDEIGNQINYKKSCAAIGILDSSANGTLTGLSITNNQISNVDAKNTDWDSGGRIAYGIIINVGGSGSFASSGKVVNAVVENNTISYLEGFIATGIGLEGNTENAVVQNNTVSYLTGYKVADRASGGYDLNGIKIENNRYVGTVTANNNTLHADTFTVNGVSPLGYAVSNYVSSSYGTLNMSGNWFGTAVLSEIMDNESLTGKVFAKYGCEISYLPFSTSAAPLNTDGLGPVTNFDEGTSYLTIQDAIDAAEIYDVITIAAGTYYENIVVNKSLSICGSGNTIINGGGTGTVVLVTANNVAVSGLTVTTCAS